MESPASTAPFAPFRLPAEAQLSDSWLGWLGAALTADDGSRIPAPPSGWAEVLPALDAHRLAPLLYTQLRNHATPSSAQFLAALAEAFRASAVRSLRMETELARVLAGLAAAEVPCLLLKGVALGQLVYPSPAERPVSDLDLLVPRERLAQAAAVLAGLGYRLHGPSPQGRLGQSFYRYRAELPAVGTLPENQGLLVELHWSLAELPYYMDRINMAEVWESARPLGGRRTLDNDDGRRTLDNDDGRRTLVRNSDPSGRRTLVRVTGRTPHLGAEHRMDAAPWCGTQDGRRTSVRDLLQIPDPAVLLLHACAHLALHHSRDLRLIWLVDLDRLARSGLDWGRVVALAEQWGLGHAAIVALSAAQRWLGTPLPSSVSDALAELPEDPVGRSMWGLGDEKLPGRWWRRALATWAAFDARQRLGYAGWLALRVALRPAEWLGRL